MDGNELFGFVKDGRCFGQLNAYLSAKNVFAYTVSLVTPVSEQFVIVFKVKSALHLISYLLRNNATQYRVSSIQLE